jgi:DNA repair photolyase
VEIETVAVGRVLTRTSGFLRGVTSHSLQPYRGCPLGRSLCGVGCYVRHSAWVTRGRPWGGFLEVRANAVESYLAHAGRERAWARREHGRFGVFLSSATEPFPPQERRHRITRSVLAAMLDEAPDLLIVQTHSPAVVEVLDLLARLAARCEVRVHLSIESDRDRLPGLPPPAAPVARRFAAALRLKEAGLYTVVTVSPLLPIDDPEGFFARVAACAHAVVLDHFIEGDGTADGRRTRATPLPAAMAAVDPASVDLSYRDRMAAVARRHLPGRVGLSAAGFAGRYA